MMTTGKNEQVNFIQDSTFKSKDVQTGKIIFSGYYNHTFGLVSDNLVFI